MHVRALCMSPQIATVRTRGPRATECVTAVRCEAPLVYNLYRSMVGAPELIHSLFTPAVRSIADTVRAVFANIGADESFDKNPEPVEEHNPIKTGAPCLGYGGW